MNRSIALLAALGVAAFAASAQAVPASAPHAASCVAALKAKEAELAGKVKAGEAAEADLLPVVRSGIAIIGAQYLAGLQEAEARLLLADGERQFAALSPEEQSARHAACLREGEDLYRHASPLERGLITTAAHRRIKRITA